MLPLLASSMGLPIATNQISTASLGLHWEARHDWATVEVLRNAAVNQNLPLTPYSFFTGQLQLMHPVTLPLWLGGLYFYLFTRAGRPLRALGFAYLIIFAVSSLESRHRPEADPFT